MQALEEAMISPEFDSRCQNTTRYKMTVAYDGSEYSGWQVQPARRTVQGELENAFRAFEGRRVVVHGSGRTDQGVHAAGQVAHVDLCAGMSSRKLCRTLNELLPGDIRVLRVAKTRSDFHARRSAVSKEYRYFIWDGEVLPPFIRRYRHHAGNRLDVASMRRAARVLVGHRDFASFAANPNRPVESTVRHLISLTVKRAGEEVLVIARSDGFLYKMVRSLAGFLLRVGEGALPCSAAESILKSGIRTAAVPTAPPAGLFLWRVTYRGASVRRGRA